jgi:hypothetical protein
MARKKNKKIQQPATNTDLPTIDTIAIRQKATYYIGELFKRKLRKIEKEPRPEGNNKNISIVNEYHDQKNEIAGVIDDIIEPLLQKQADIELRQNRHSVLLHKNEKENSIFRKLFKTALKDPPIILSPTNDKIQWSKSFKDAANEIIKNYKNDLKADFKKYRSLRDASDEFFESHYFTHRPNYTSEQLYENVKQANSPWLKKWVKTG